MSREEFFSGLLQLNGRLLPFFVCVLNCTGWFRVGSFGHKKDMWLIVLSNPPRTCCKKNVCIFVLSLHSNRYPSVLHG